MAIQREHCIQKHARLWAREALDCEYEFFAFDRAKATSQWSHMREKMRGVQRATPDTLLKTKNRRGIWFEFKSTGNRPTSDQMDMGARLMALGDAWGWGTSVDEYRLFMDALDVPMHPNAAFLAMHHDELVASEIAKAEAKAGMEPKPLRVKSRAEKTPAARIARYHRIRARTMI